MEMPKNLVTITDFAKSRNEDRDTVNAFIRNHPEIKAYVTKQGKHTVIDIDSEGYRLLEKQYPLIKPVETIVGIDPKEHAMVCRELAAAERKLSEWAQEKAKLQIEYNNLEAEMFLLEEKKDLEIQSKELENQNIRQENELKNEKIEDLAAAKKELEDELERLKRRNLFERIFKKGE